MLYQITKGTGLAIKQGLYYKSVMVCFLDYIEANGMVLSYELLSSLVKSEKTTVTNKFLNKTHLHMWQPREFLFLKVFLQYWQTTTSDLALESWCCFCMSTSNELTCACLWCAWTKHARTTAADRTGRSSSLPPHPGSLGLWTRTLGLALCWGPSHMMSL